MTGFTGLFYYYDYLKRHSSEEYLYEEGWSQSKYMKYLKMRAIYPGYSGMTDKTIGLHDNEYYMKRNNLDWSDVLQPWNLPGSSLIEGYYSDLSGYARQGLNFVSSNVNRLYNDRTRQRVSDAYDRGFRNANSYWRNYLK